ncbi:multicopper oxidase family protein [Methylomarinum vadi]|uniref:multicopper oxidase family protein n=1 Tax=Methylomarinum vadi TaxID=438855 RepID=UPI0004DFA67E|nr:multicopper oxidase domain-containing protein [Methylomarinum vadi]
MSSKINPNRRKFLQYSAMTAAAATTSFPSFLHAMGGAGKYAKPSADFHPDVEIELQMESTKIPIFDGPKTRIWKVHGKVLKGSPDSVTNDPDTYLAPTLHLHKGQKIRIYLKNNLPAESILHWHGLHVPADMDGNPMFAIHHGETFVYEFEILNRAGTYWYHAHTHGVTAKQVYSGLAGLFIVSDPEEQALDLPKGPYDLPIVIQDRSFFKNNQLYYSTQMMHRMHGFLGDRLFINGRPDFKLSVETRSYRLRLLNGSNSRIYKLAWDDGTPITVIGTDGGLLEQPTTVPYVMLAPGQRRELWVDFSGKSVGTELTMRSLPFAATMMHGMMGGGMGMGGGRGGMMGRHHGGMGDGMMGGMGRGMMGGGALPSGGDYPVLTVKVTKQADSNSPLPTRLSSISKLRLEDAVNSDNPRSIVLSMRHMSALLNGRSYKMNDIRPDEVIPVNTLQLMTFDNGFRGGHHGMAMPHPMHLHGEQFQIVKREHRSNFRNSQATVEQGLVDQGWQDTVLVMPGERVTFLKPFNHFKGMFMYHCHNLEHEDLGMMRDFLVK